MRERGAWAEWRAGRGKGAGRGRAGSSRLRLDSVGGAGKGEFVEAAAAPGGVQVTLK